MVCVARQRALTLPSRGRPQASFACLRPPLMSNVRPPNMEMSRDVRKAFDAWVGVPTWHTGHPLDEKRFYRFVWEVYRLSRGRRPTESHLRGEIVAAWGDQLEDAYLRQKAKHYANLYEHLYTFAKAKSLFS